MSGLPRLRAQLAVTLRPYQERCIDEVRRAYRAGHRRVLVVMATGLGKTVVFADIARRVVAKGGRVLVLAHRNELIDQAARKLRALDLEVGIEKAAQTAGDADVVVASVQTLRGERLASWPRGSFGMVVIDEAHHAAAQSYRSVLEHFGRAHVLGVTATPDRADGKGLGEVFDTVAFEYGIQQAIADGWLAPIRCTLVHSDDIDLSQVRTARGDLHTGDLSEVMSADGAVRAVVEPLLELSGSRPAIVFAASIGHARALAAKLNESRPGCARWVSGKTGMTERVDFLDDFEAGRYQYLVNVAVLTEGYDCPPVSCVAMARPTKSRPLYAQCVGRGTRLHPGKRDCLVLDFAGNAGRHRLVSPADLLAGSDADDELLAIARQLHEQQPAADPGEVLEQARIAQRNQIARARIDYWTERIDPFLGATMPEPAIARGVAATDGQVGALARYGIKNANLSKGQAGRLLSALAERRRLGFCTFKQAKKLAGYGIDARFMSFEKASEALSEIQHAGWAWRHELTRRSTQ